ncbi:MAG: two-component regulator propeller domain-containing protein [Candidatus Cryptobacteroides sp.]
MKRHYCLLQALKALLCAVLLVLCPMLLRGQTLSFRSIPSKLLPTAAVRILFCDSEGYIWIPTYSGLVRYDGASTVVYGVNEWDNEVFDCHLNVVCESAGGMLWIASEKGVYTLDKKTGHIAFAGPDPAPNNISDILCNNNRDVWAGGSTGLWHIDASTGEFTPLLYESEPITSVSSLYEDPEGYLWIACCEQALYRYDLRTGSIRRFSDDALAWSNVVFKDRQGRLWIGTWGKGLLRVDHPYRQESLSYTVYSSSEHPGSLLDDIVYDIESDAEGHLMVASRSGLSIMGDVADPYSFVNCTPGDSEYDLPYNEVSSILKTADGSIWLSMFCGGVCKMEQSEEHFRTDDLNEVRKQLKTNSVRSIYPMPNGRLWLGIIGYGMVLYNPDDGSFLTYDQYPSFKDFPYTSSVDVIKQRRSTSQICFGTYSQGLWLLDSYPEGAQALRVSSARYPAFSRSGVTAIEEDGNSNLWLGTRKGIYILSPSGELLSLGDYLPFDSVKSLSEISVTDLKTARDGSVWIATNYNGVYRLNPSDGAVDRLPLGQSSYNVSCLFVDASSNVWAGSPFDGLYLYNQQNGVFESISNISALLHKGITGISSDSSSKLWVTTFDSAVSFNYSSEAGFTDVSFNDLSVSDPSMSFNTGTLVNLPDGTMAAGSSKGIVHFLPSERKARSAGNETLCFTDFKLGESSLRTLPEGERKKVCETDINYARQVKISHDINSFSISFALLNKGNSGPETYSYILEGYDRKEVIDAEGGHTARYENVPPGTYLFRLRTPGRERVYERTLKIRVMCNPLLSPWAIIAYILAVILLAYIAWRYTFDRMKAREQVNLSRMETQKVEELNHLKLQFYTNVTHELMTPLSIINASVESLSQGRWSPDLPKVLSVNTARLTRLLQQMLEFRKVESGNLKLSVSRGNLTGFVSSCIEAFTPLISGKKQKLSFCSSPDQIEGWFDSDKLDKIIYNLLSNASKYTPEGGEISVKISVLADGMFRLDIANSGDLMSEKTIKGLFKRFYEGDYRKHNTIGTGIGLSLVKDLVQLHKGSIAVRSNQQEGNVFTVSFPIGEESYAGEEMSGDQADRTCPVMVTSSSVEISRPYGLKGEYTILFVDDNIELCELVKSMLEEHFTVLTAGDGQEALRILAEGNVSLVVSDVMMPRLDGLELCRTIKSRFEYCHIPVILLTAKSAEESQIEGWQAGADGYVCKPFSMKLLTTQIVECLKKVERQGADFRKQIVLDVDDLEYTSMDETFLRRAIDCVNAHYKDCDFDLPEFVSAMGTSKTVLTEKLKALTGMSPGAFINNVRMTVAYKALSENKPDIRISDVAFSVGFNDPKYFSSCFKKKYGVTPKAFLDSLK